MQLSSTAAVHDGAMRENMLEDPDALDEPRRLTVIDGGPDGNRARAETAVAALLTALGRDTAADGLKDTPRRVVDSFLELLTPQEFSATTFPNTEGYRDLVLVKEIPFHSLSFFSFLPYKVNLL